MIIFSVGGMMEAGFVKTLINKINFEEQFITSLAVHSKNLDTLEVSEKLMNYIQQKNLLVAKLKKIKLFMKKLNPEEMKLFDLFFVKGVAEKKLIQEFSYISRRTIWRKIKRLKEKAMEYGL